MRVLLVEDDRSLARIIAGALEKAGYGVDCCTDGEAGLACALDPQRPYALVLLDRMLPVIDGLTILKAMRSKKLSTPVILITGLGSLEDRLEGFDVGADDYLVKPFSVRELTARVRALIRRPPEIVEEELLSAGGICLNRARRELSCGERSLRLTGKEARLLGALLAEPDRVHSREELLWQVWGSDGMVEAGNVDNYIHFLRKRLRELNAPVQIATVYGSGYRLEENR